MAASKRSPRTAVGAAGEDLAAAHLERLGMRILARNWRPRGTSVRGEIDLVALDQHCLVICEVKTRRGSAAGHPLEAVTARKLAQLRRLAAAYLAEGVRGVPEVRIDVVGVCYEEPDRATVSHVRGVA